MLPALLYNPQGTKSHVISDPTQQCALICHSIYSIYRILNPMSSAVAKEVSSISSCYCTAVSFILILNLVLNSKSIHYSFEIPV